MEPTNEQLRVFLDALDADEARTTALINDYIGKLKQTTGDRDAFMLVWQEIRTNVELPVAMDLAVTFGGSAPKFDWTDVFNQVFRAWQK